MYTHTHKRKRKEKKSNYIKRARKRDFDLHDDHFKF